MEGWLIKRFKSLQEFDKIDDEALKRERGRKFEDLIHEVFETEGTLLKRGFHTDGTRAEQIDGAIEIWGRVLLLEAKWVNSNIAASELFSFLGKVENKFQGTLGVFISRNELSENFLSALNRGRRQCIIVVHGDDIDLLFGENGPSFSAYLEYCIKLMSYDNITHYPVRKYMDALNAANSLRYSNNKEAKDFVLREPTSTSYGKEEAAQSYSELPYDSKKVVYRFALDNYSKVISSVVSRSSSPHKSYLESEFFQQFDSSSQEVRETVPYFFTEVIHRDYMAYAANEILRLYTPLYKVLSDDEKGIFESQMISNLKVAVDDQMFGTEGDILMIVEPLWDQLNDETRAILKSILLEIYTSKERLDNYYQKTLAKYQIVMGKITRNDIEKWLAEKASTLAKDYFDNSIDDLWGLQQDLLELFVSAFGSLAPLMAMDKSTFTSYVRELLEEARN